METIETKNFIEFLQTKNLIIYLKYSINTYYSSLKSTYLHNRYYYNECILFDKKTGKEIKRYNISYQIKNFLDKNYNFMECIFIHEEA